MEKQRKTPAEILPEIKNRLTGQHVFRDLIGTTETFVDKAQKPFSSVRSEMLSSEDIVQDVERRVVSLRDWTLATGKPVTYDGIHSHRYESENNTTSLGAEERDSQVDDNYLLAFNHRDTVLDISLGIDFYFNGRYSLEIGFEESTDKSREEQRYETGIRPMSEMTDEEGEIIRDYLQDFMEEENIPYQQ